MPRSSEPDSAYFLTLDLRHRCSMVFCSIKEMILLKIKHERYEEVR